jgi:dTDP-4-dehydrorhamnose 3,5-epimerase
VTSRGRRIDGVQVKPLKVVPDERGWLMEVLRSDDEGLVYVSATYPGVVKAWHYHMRQTDNFACIAGMVKLVLVDTREASSTRDTINEFVIGVQNPVLVQVPRMVYHGWKCISLEPSLVINVPDEPYDRANPDERRMAPHGTLPYDWTRQDG